MKHFYFILFAAALFIQQSFAQSVVVGTVKDSVTGSNILSGSIEFVPIDTPKTNSAGELLFGYKTVAYINDGKFANGRRIRSKIAKDTNIFLASRFSFGFIIINNPNVTKDI